MHGAGGRPGWSWIFILEGILTVLAGFASFYMVLDFPHETKQLTPDEKERVLRRLADDQQLGSGTPETEFKASYLVAALKDWKTWLSMAIYMGCDMPLYAFSLFLPSIIDELDLGLDHADIQRATCRRLLCARSSYPQRRTSPPR